MKKRIFALLIIAAFVFLVALPLSGGQAQVPAAPQVSTTATFRVAIADPTVGTVDVRVDGVVSSLSSMQNVAALEASGYATISEGAHTISLVQAGTSTMVGPEVTFTAAAKADYTLVLLPGLTWTAAPLIDAKPVPAWPTVNVRLANFSPNNNPASLSINGTVPAEFSDIAYKSTSADYANMANGTYNLQIQGTTAPIRPFDFQPGHVYTVFLFWDPAKNAPSIYVKTDADFSAGTPVATTAVPTSTATTQVTPTVALPAARRVFIPLISR